MDEILSEELRELGKLDYFHSKPDRDRRNEGLQELTKASNMGDLEAMYILGWLLLEGKAKAHTGDSKEYGLRLIRRASWNGYLPARTYLNKLFADRYKVEQARKKVASAKTSGPLRDFNGKKIKINRSGLLVPVDAKLTCEHGENELRLSTNIGFIYMDDSLRLNKRAFEKAVAAGFKAWEGVYQVFGDQRLKVSLEIVEEDRYFDQVLVVPLSSKDVNGIKKHIKDSKLLSVLQNEKTTGVFDTLNKEKRSFAINGIREWSVRTRKFIYFQQENDDFSDFDEIQNVAKHEFGHVLGIGDLYRDPSIQLNGVGKGKYSELDAFHVSENSYYQVMDDCYAPVSNNDIEMVVLAFATNKFQRFQPDQRGSKVSEALGKGN